MMKVKEEFNGFECKLGQYVFVDNKGISRIDIVKLVSDLAGIDYTYYEYYEVRVKDIEKSYRWKLDEFCFKIVKHDDKYLHIGNERFYLKMISITFHRHVNLMLTL